MSTILLVDEDRKLLRVLRMAFSQYRFDLSMSRNKVNILRKAQRSLPDLILINLRLPGPRNLEVCEHIRQAMSVPMIMVLRQDQLEVIEKDTQNCISDYLVEPYSQVELFTRIYVQLHMQPPASSLASTMRVGVVTIHVEDQKVDVAGREINLTPTEYRLLLCLVQHQGDVVPHNTLLQEVWGEAYVNQVGYLRLYIRYLRRKIEPNPHEPHIIQTVHGVGYTIASPSIAE